MKKTSILMILDGYGMRDEAVGNAVKAAVTPNLDSIFSRYPHTTLGASGLDVGLPDGQMGNSEVGHTNIGAGRIVYQELTKISKEIDNGSFFENGSLTGAMNNVLANNSALHIMGLLSDGGVHSHTKHIFALLKLAHDMGLQKVFVHCFLDGRDVPPQCAEKYIIELEEYMNGLGAGKIATVSGRYYAMDRDSRFERLVLAYDALTLGTGQTSQSAAEAVKNAYERGETDEFVLPTIVSSEDSESLPTAVISDNDSVIMYNFRPDRAREITRALVDQSFIGFERTTVPQNLYYVCMTQYDASMPNVHVAFPPQSLHNTIGEYISSLGKRQLRIAETEKYAHVTFFFNGGIEDSYSNEDRILIPSPKVATYDMQPEMSAYKVTDALLDALDKNIYDLIIINYANCDMVGHTGVFDAAVKAVQAVDECVGKITEKLLSQGGQMLLTADHGNADMMLDEEGNIVTAHSLSRVPLVFISNESEKGGYDNNTGSDSNSEPYFFSETDSGVLADLAPTLLYIMNLEIPADMTGKILLKRR